jgi:hypothetical protein
MTEPRTADAAIDLRDAASIVLEAEAMSPEDKVILAALAARLESSARLRHLEDAVLDAAERWEAADRGSDPKALRRARLDMKAAVRALKDARENQ